MDDTQLVIRRCKRSNDKRLELKNKNLVTLPGEVFQLSQLEELDVSCNKLQQVDSRLADLPQLRIINLANNQVKTLPNCLASMGLHQLIVTNNPLTKPFDQLLLKENMGYAGLDATLKNIFNPQSPSITHPPSQHHQFMANRVKELEEQVNKLNLQQKSNGFNMYSQHNSQYLQNNSSPKNSQSAQNVLGLDQYLCRQLEVDPVHLTTKEVISQGGFSIVYKGNYKGCDVAVKQIFDPNITEELLEQVGTEIKCLAYFRHPNIVQVMGIVSTPSKLAIVTDYMPMSLFQVVHKYQASLKEEQKVQIAMQLAKALQFIHLSGYIHRDVKSHNVLLDHHYLLKLCDFGLTKEADQVNKGLNQFWGTPSYMAPELFQKKSYDHKIDVFAYGNVLYEIYEKQLPFDGFEVQDIMPKVIKGEPLPYKYCNKQMQNLIDSCRQLDPQLRPDMGTIINKLNTSF